MRLARPVGIAVLAGAVVAGFALDSVAVRPTTARLVTIPSPIQPLISTRESLSTTWYCPGVPASGASGETGSFTLANLTDSPVDASVTVVPVGGASVRKVVALGQRGRIELVAADIAPGAVAAAMIEVAGGSIAVEQTSVTPAGSSVAACTTEPSDLWLFADGSTRSDASLNILLFNPYPAEAIVDLAFADEDGPRISKKFEGRVVPPRSLARIDVGLVIQRKASVSVKASVRQGSIIAGRLQSFTGGDSGRRGLTSGLGSPAGASAWRFVAGQRPVAAPTDVPSAERIAIFNPGDNEAQIAITVLLESDATAATSGTPPGAVPTPLTLTVPANSSAIADVASIAPAGQFNVSVTADELIVAERVLDYTLKGVVFTTVQLGSRLAAETWYFPIGVPTGATGRIDVLNSTGVPTTFSVKTVGAAGPVAVAGFESVKLPAGAVVSVPITGLSVGQSLVVEGAGALIVERMVNSPAGWSATLGLPMIG